MVLPLLLVSSSLVVGAGSTARTEVSPAPAPVDVLEIAKLREWFNAASGSVRLISLLSPT